MPIHFREEQWARVRENYALWWAGKLDRPLIKMPVQGVYSPGEKTPRAPRLSQQNCHDFSFSPEELIEAIDYELSTWEFLGDSFPYVNFEVFGPGVASAFCGARLDNSSGRVWFFPPEKLPIEEITIKYDPENKWVQRIKAIYRAGQQRWGDQVIMAMPDLGGILDIVAVFRESEDLLMDLYDNPEEVLRLCDEAHDAWMEAYRDLNQTLQPINPGYTDWGGIYSEKPSYILQSDFSYMIGTPMFDQFTLPYLEKSCHTLHNTIYHLDGVNQLSHLDHILGIPELNAIQWVYGDGQPSARHWIEVYEKIQAAGKGIYFIGDWKDLEIVYPRVHQGLYLNTGSSNRQQAVDLLNQFHVPL